MSWLSKIFGKNKVKPVQQQELNVEDDTVKEIIENVINICDGIREDILKDSDESRSSVNHAKSLLRIFGEGLYYFPGSEKLVVEVVKRVEARSSNGKHLKKIWHEFGFYDGTDFDNGETDKRMCDFCGKKVIPFVGGEVSLEQAYAMMKELGYLCDTCNKVTCVACSSAVTNYSVSDKYFCPACKNEVHEL